MCSALWRIKLPSSCLLLLPSYCVSVLTALLSYVVLILGKSLAHKMKGLYSRGQHPHIQGQVRMVSCFNYRPSE